ITVLVAKNRPHGPDLGASMASGEAVGVMEDAKQPEYRLAATPPAPDAEREPVALSFVVTPSARPPRPVKTIQSPSKCTSCGARSHSTTTGVDLDRCDRCGGTVVHECGPECGWHSTSPAPSSGGGDA